MRTKIIGTGSYLPQKVVTNDDLAQTLDTSDDWIKSRTGIHARHVADYLHGETGSFMSTQAAKNALAMAELSSSDIDLIISATITPDYRLPSSACIIQNALGATSTPAFDIAAACAGSVYGLSIANSFIKSGTYKNILLVASEVMSSVVDPSDRNTAILFGDGASAAVLSATDSETQGFIDFDLYADGSQKEIITVPAGGTACPIDAQVLNDRRDKVSMNGRETYKFAVRAMCDAIERILHRNGLTADDIAFAVPHQANLRIIEAIASRVNLPLDRFLINMDRCANTSAASLMLAYDEANRAHRLKQNDLILMLAIGAGFVWGASLYRV